MRFRRNRIVCRRAVELVTDYLEGTLTRSERARFEKHLRGCPHCTEYLAQIRATIRAVGRAAPDSLEPQIQADLVDLYRRWRADAP